MALIILSENTIMKFEELDEQQQARAIEKHRDINVEHETWNDWVKDEHHEKLELAGFEGVESRYSGFCSQGDGASFIASNVDIEKFLRHVKRWTHYRPLHEFIRINEITAKVVALPSHYVHYNTTEAELSGDWYIDFTPKQEALYEELQKEIDDYITQAGKDYYDALYTAYYDLISDEQVKETIIINELDFEETDYSVSYI